MYNFIERHVMDLNGFTFFCKCVHFLLTGAAMLEKKDTIYAVEDER